MIKEGNTYTQFIKNVQVYMQKNNDNVFSSTTLRSLLTCINIRYLIFYLMGFYCLFQIQVLKGDHYHYSHVVCEQRSILPSERQGGARRHGSAELFPPRR